MKPITLTPIFARIFDAMDIRDRAVGFIVGPNDCAPTAHGAGSFQIDVSAGTGVSNSGVFTTFGGGNKTPGALVNPNASRCDLLYFDNAFALQILAGVEVVVTPNTPAVPPLIPAGGTPIALAYITPGAVDYGVATSAFVEDIRQFYAPMFLPDGAQTAPSLPFGNEKGTGLFRSGAGRISLAVLNAQVAEFGSAFLVVGAGGAQSGTFRVPNNSGGLRARNAAVSADFQLIDLDAANVIQIGGPTPAPVVISGASLSVGTTPATAGLIRIPNNSALAARNAANSANLNLILLDASDNISLPTQPVVMSGSSLSIGTNPATAGIIRLANNTTIQERNAANNANISLIGLDSSNNVLLAPITTAGDLIVGGTSGIAQRLAKGADGNFLQVVAGVVTWGAGGGGTNIGSVETTTNFSTTSTTYVQVTNVSFSFTSTNAANKCLVFASVPLFVGPTNSGGGWRIRNTTDSLSIQSAEYSAITNIPGSTSGRITTLPASAKTYEMQAKELGGGTLVINHGSDGFIHLGIVEYKS